MKVRKIISGGQTGVDRAALDFALANGVEIGGFVPHGRIAEDGRIPDRYIGLTETASDDPAERTELNVLNSDATLIIARGPLTGGSKLTAEFAGRYNKPHLQIDLNSVPPGSAPEIIRNWVESIVCPSLNIAGPRASEDPEIYEMVSDILQRAFV